MDRGTDCLKRGFGPGPGPEVDREVDVCRRQCGIDEAVGDCAGSAHLLEIGGADRHEDGLFAVVDRHFTDRRRHRAEPEGCTRSVVAQLAARPMQDVHRRRAAQVGDEREGGDGGHVGLLGQYGNHALWSL